MTSQQIQEQYGPARSDGIRRGHRHPFDEIAVEEAVRLKQKGVATEVVAPSCGVTQNPDQFSKAVGA